MERIAVVMGKMHSGGKKNLVMEYYRNIDRSKIQFDFICDADSNAIPKDEIKELGGRVYEIAPYQHIFKNMSDMRKICKSNNYKIMHSYNGTMNLFSMFVGWLTHIPVRINESISMGHSADKKTILKNILKPFSRMFATHFMSNGEVCGRWQFGDKLYNEGKVKVFKTVINTDINKFDPEVRDRTRAEYGIEDNIVIGHIGRLTEQKNTLFIIDIFNEIIKQEPKAKLLIIGDGNLREAMLDKIKSYGISENVLYLGRREDIQQFYNAMDCFLLPSLYEGLPVVGVEAENCGLPMFFSTEIPKESSACPDLGHFISLDKSAKEWADDVLKAAKKSIGKRTGRTEEVKAAGFDSGIEAEKLLDYYENVLSEIK
ncbi:MAG: glycosyltransferase [Oscillospiraceae bacterium]